MLTVLDAATITSQPHPQTVTTGDTATFSVTATGGALSTDDVTDHVSFIIVSTKQ